MKKRVWALVLSLALCLTFVGCAGSRTEAERDILSAIGGLRAAILSIGKADAMVITTDHVTMVIDTGEKDDGSKLLSYLYQNGISTVDYLVITHYDRDHVGGAARLLQSIKVRQVIRPDYVGEREEYSAFVNALAECDIADNAMAAGGDLVFMMEDVQVHVNAPLKEIYVNEKGEQQDNNLSLVVQLYHGRNRLLFAGDCEDTRLAELVRSDRDWSADFLKVPHHGNYGELSAEFFQKVHPTWAVICDSEKNPADEKTLAALKAEGSTVFQTKDGTVLCESDGKALAVTQTPKE